MQWANAGFSTDAGAGRGHHALAITGIALVVAPLACVMLGGWVGLRGGSPGRRRKPPLAADIDGVLRDMHLRMCWHAVRQRLRWARSGPRGGVRFPRVQLTSLACV